MKYRQIDMHDLDRAAQDAVERAHLPNDIEVINRERPSKADRWLKCASSRETSNAA